MFLEVLILRNETKWACKGRVPYKGLSTRKPGYLPDVNIKTPNLEKPVQKLKQLKPGHLPQVPHLNPASVQLNLAHSSSIHFKKVIFARVSVPYHHLCGDYFQYWCI